MACLSCGDTQKEHQAGIAISFDDRYVAQWDSLRPLLKKYDVKATFYMTQFDSLTATEKGILLQLQKEGHEIGAHGATHTRAVDYALSQSTDAFIKNEVEAEINAMKKAGLHVSTYAHPGGQQAWFINQKLYNYFNLVRDVALSERKIAGFTFKRELTDMDEIYYKFDGNKNVDALLIDQAANLSIKELNEGLLKAKNTNTVLMLFGHRPLFKPSEEGYAFRVTMLENILKEAKRLNLKSYTMSELVNERPNN